MSLSSLPAVLVQSLMRSLHVKEILSLARCCKWTLECADSAFAWRDCPPFELLWTTPLVLPPPSRLCRWIPLALLPHKLRYLSEANAAHLMSAVQPHHRIVKFGWSIWLLPVARGRELLSHPCMQNARDIGVSRDIHASWLAAAALLPCLSEMDLRDSPLYPSDQLLPLVRARALRRLFVSERVYSRMPAVMQLTQIRMLHVDRPRIDARNFLACCTAMGGLEEWQLRHWDHAAVRSISYADLAAGFRALCCLRVLAFIGFFDERTLAPVLGFAPALRLLRLLDTRVAPEDEPALIARMQEAAPLLRVLFEERIRGSKSYYPICCD